MSETLIEKHEALVVEMATAYLDNMEVELGRKYKDITYDIDAGLSQEQHKELKSRFDIADQEYTDLYLDFKKMEPTDHLTKAMAAFTASGGNVEIEPGYDEETKRLSVDVNFSIKDRNLEKIEGLSELEDKVLRMNAMLQVDTLLSGSDPTVTPEF